MPPGVLMPSALVDRARFFSKARGIFKLWIYQHGQLIERFEDDNLIVDNAKTLVSHLIAGDTSNRIITQIGYGTSGTAAATGNTALTSPFYKAVGAITYPTTSSVRFAFSLLTGENNGVAILEFGLLTANNSLFARKVRATPLNKDVTISFSGTWDIIF